MPTHRQNALAKFIGTRMREENLTNLADAAEYTRHFLWAWWETAPQDERAKLGNVVPPLLNRLSALAAYLACDEGLPVPDSLDGLAEIMAIRNDQRKASTGEQPAKEGRPLNQGHARYTAAEKLTEFLLAKVQPAIWALALAADSVDKGIDPSTDADEVARRFNQFDYAATCMRPLIATSSKLMADFDHAV